MKKLLLVLLVLLAAHIANTANAHEGMIALYADPSASSCQVDLPQFQLVKLYLFYIRGDGPRFYKSAQFKLLKSTDEIVFGMPEFPPEHGIVLTLGNLESGISIAYHAGERDWVAPDTDTFFLGTIPVLNTSDADTFTVSVVKDPGDPYDKGLNISTGFFNDFSIYEVIGGTFVFNGDCNSPEDPFGTALGIETSTWGAIKEIFSE